MLLHLCLSPMSKAIRQQSKRRRRTLVEAQLKVYIVKQLLFASVPDVSEAQSHIHTVTLLLLGSLADLRLRRLQLRRVGALV